MFKVDIDQGRTGALVREGIIEMKKLSIDSPIKNAHSGYRDKAICIMSIQHKSVL